MFVTAAVLMAFVKKPGLHFSRTPYGPRRYGPARKANKRQNRNEMLANLEVLRIAAASEPEVPTRLYKPLNFWKRQLMTRKLDETRRVQEQQSAAPGSEGVLAAVQSVTRAIQQQRERLRLTAPQLQSPAAAPPALPLVAAPRRPGAGSHVRSFSSWLWSA